MSDAPPFKVSTGDLPQDVDEEIPEPAADPMPGEPPTPAPGDRLGKILKRSELASLPDVQQLIDGVVSRPAAVVLVGPTGVGKTFLTISWGGSVATGRPWLGRAVHRTRVLYILGEGAYGIDHRLITWEAATNSGQSISDDNLTFIVQPDSLARPGTWAAITEMAVTGGYRFVILDTFSSLAPDADETKDAAMIMRRLSNLATSIEGTVLLVHHPGWADATRTRGGYQFQGNADEVLLAAPLSEGSDIFTLTRKKVKGSTRWSVSPKAATSPLPGGRTRSTSRGSPTRRGRDFGDPSGGRGSAGSSSTTTTCGLRSRTLAMRATAAFSRAWRPLPGTSSSPSA